MFTTLEQSWKEVLKEELTKPYLQELQNFLKKQAQEGAVIYPPRSLLFQAFAETPFNEVKVVIVGQDPYHGVGQAHGLCFSVPCGIPCPPSLKNIFLELFEDLKVPIIKTGCLQNWAKQGVLLLNATLTVESSKPASHYGKGWEQFTDRVIQVLTQREDPIIFVLWGKNAQQKFTNVIKDTSKHVVLMAAHPSPFSAYQGFLGCRHFSKINQLLKGFGKSEINWNLN